MQYVPDNRAAYTQGIITPGSDFPPTFIAAVGHPPTVDDGWIANCVFLSVENEKKWPEALTPSQLVNLRTLVWAKAAEHGFTPSADTAPGHYRFDDVNRANCPHLSPEEWDYILRPSV